MSESSSPNKFDIAAIKAEDELKNLLENLDSSQLAGAKQIFSWHVNNYMHAGHKRLGRILVKIEKKSKPLDEISEIKQKVDIIKDSGKIHISSKLKE